MGINDLQTTYPEMAAELGEGKSGFTAKQITYASNKKAWFNEKDTKNIRDRLFRS